ncbi:MAG: hypothetical protein JWP10_703, partial [Nocardioidaceae bacterium]|nr:hypothetical protein [Nocardioidaceae bacterium]
MAHRLQRSLLVVLASFALFGATLLAVPTAQASGSGQIVGRITDAATHKGLNKIHVQVFTSTWGYIGEVKAKKSGVYRISSREIGGYHLKFVDTRPRFDTTAHVTKEAYVRVTQTEDPTVKNAKMHQGGTVYGTVKLKKGRAKGARVVAANDFGSYEVTADDKGRFALGGLAPGKYTVFAWDAKGTYTGSPKFVGKIKAGRSKGVVVTLKTRSGGLSGVLTVDGKQAFETVYVTAVNKKSGQWWTQKITFGDLSALQGLAPGKYKLIVPGFQGHLGRTVTLSAKVVSGKTRDIFPVNL